MKKILAFLFLAIVSCNNDDSARVASINPNLLQKIIINPGMSSERHWNFYDNGLLKEIRKADGTLLESFEYDTNNNLTTNINYESGTPVIQTFDYDSNHYLIAVNSNPLSLNSITNTYTTDVWEYTNAEGTFSGHNTTVVNSDKLIINSTRYATEVLIDGTYTESETLVNCSYNDNNLIDFSFNDGATGCFYTFDNNQNPLKNAVSAICKANCLSNSKWLQGEYNSINNIITKGYALEDPEHYTFDYIYNSNNLPVTRTTNNYYLDTLESSEISIKYYYQGDIVP